MSDSYSPQVNGVRIVVDTNVWVDNYCSFHKNCNIVRHFIDIAMSYDAILMYPVHEIKDVFYLLGHEFRRYARSEEQEITADMARAIDETTWACIANMREIATAIGADESDVWLASKYRAITGDLEDNLVLAAAERAKANYLVTSDQNLIAHSTVATLTPEDMTRVLEAKA